MALSSPLALALTALLATPCVAAPLAVQPNMSWLDNGTIRLGVDTNLGGAITWLSRSGDELNVINSHDWGRQVQMSFYSGPVPFTFEGKAPKPVWEHLGWNPIQAGDDFGHGSRVLELQNDGRRIHLTCVPMQWPLDGVPGDCTFDSWLELEGARVIARGRLNNARADKTAYPARGQELPAVYTNAPFHRLITYSGPHPFHGEPFTAIKTVGPPSWVHYYGTEGWSALVNDEGWGLGVWNPACIEFSGGFSGAPGQGGAKDAPCGYIAPARIEILDHNIQYDFNYELILGTLEEIRAAVYAHPATLQPPRWTFAHDRAGWTYRHAIDAGWPVAGELNMHWAETDPSLVSPPFCWPAPHGATLMLEAAHHAHEPMAELFWSTLSHPGFSPDRAVRFQVQGDGEFHEYRVKIPSTEDDPLTQLRFDPADAAGGDLRLRSAALVPND